MSDAPNAWSYAKLSPTGIKIDPDIPYEAWEELGESLHRAVDASYWALGEWVEFGEVKFGERYAAAISPDRSRRVEQARWVSKKVPCDIRHENLSHSHHRAVAGLSDTFLMARLLDMAEANNWVVATLAAAVKRAKETDGADLMPWQPVEPETATRLFGEGGAVRDLLNNSGGSLGNIGASLRVVAGTDVVEPRTSQDYLRKLLFVARIAIQRGEITDELIAVVEEIDRLEEAKQSA